MEPPGPPSSYGHPGMPPNMMRPPMPPGGGGWPGMPMPPGGPPMPPGAPPMPPGAPPMPPPGYTGMPGMRPPMPPQQAPSAQPPRPHNTLYLNNLTEKEKIESLKKALYHIFSQFGNIVEIHAKKAQKLKGQAWIVFENTESATKALGEMNGFDFYGKPMKVDFARVKSDVISQKDGTFVHRPLRKKMEKKKKKKKKVKKEKKEEEGEEDAVVAGPAPPPPAEGMKDEAGVEQDIKPTPPPARRPPPQAAPAPPNRILFVENLPDQCTDTMLSMLLQPYDGFKEARLVTGKPGIAFVEFGDQFQAGTAKDHLQNFCITPSHPMKITFARQ